MALEYAILAWNVKAAFKTRLSSNQWLEAGPWNSDVTMQLFLPAMSRIQALSLLFQTVRLTPTTN